MFRKLGTELDELSEIRVFSLKDFSLVDTIQTKGFSFVKYCKDNMYYAFSPEGTDKINLCRRSLKTERKQSCMSLAIQKMYPAVFLLWQVIYILYVVLLRWG
jgi:hypothetical protein